MLGKERGSWKETEALRQIIMGRSGEREGRELV